MLVQARQLKSELPENVIIKIPCTPEGLAATKVLTDEGVDTNVTPIFSASQALDGRQSRSHLRVSLHWSN